MAKGCALSTGYLPRGDLPRNSVDRITDRPDMTSAVGRGHKASSQIKKQIIPGYNIPNLLKIHVLATAGSALRFEGRSRTAWSV